MTKPKRDRLPRSPMAGPGPPHDDSPLPPAQWPIAVAILWPIIVLVLYARLVLVPGLISILGLD